MAQQYQYQCPYCDKSGFSPYSFLADHLEGEHPELLVSDHDVPPEMHHFLGSAVECG
jgi:hypothetical protein